MLKITYKQDMPCEVFLAVGQSVSLCVPSDWIVDHPNTYFAMLVRHCQSPIQTDLCAKDLELVRVYMDQGVFPCPFIKDNRPIDFESTEELIDFLGIPYDDISDIIDYDNWLETNELGEDPEDYPEDYDPEVEQARQEWMKDEMDDTDDEEEDLKWHHFLRFYDTRRKVAQQAKENQQREALVCALKEEFKIKNKEKVVKQEYAVLLANIGCDKYIIRRICSEQMRAAAVKLIQVEEEKMANMPINSSQFVLIHPPDRRY